MRATNAARSSGVQPSVKSSSSWSMISTASGRAPMPAASSASSGSAPGRSDDRVRDRRCETGERDGRLAAPGRADDCDEPVRPEQLQAARDDVFAAEEQVGILTRERREAGIGATRRIGRRGDAVGDHGGDVVAPVDAAQIGSGRARGGARPSVERRRPRRRRCREQDLTGTCEITDPRRAIHGRTHDVVVDGDELASRHPDPNVHALRRGSRGRAAVQRPRALR